MYWLRSFDLIPIILTVLLSAAWMVGGWLLGARLFSLSSRERLTGGIALGFGLYLTSTNLLAAWLDLPAAAWLSAGLVLGAGVGLALRGGRPWFDPGDWASWRQMVWLAGLTVLFTLIGRSLALFDDYLHLPLVSRLAMGDFPAHFYLNTTQYFAYHYGLQVWAASLVRMAGMFPWSAWDLAKAFAIALTFMLGYVWVRRQTQSRLAGWLGSLTLVVGGGARWLLLLFPASTLLGLSQQVTLINTGADTAASLAAALGGDWIIEGGGHFAFPFAFHNGVFVPVISVLGSTGALPFLTILLLLLLVEKRDLRWMQAGVLALLLANLALSAEHLFAFLWAGLFVVWLAAAIDARRKPDPAQKRLGWAWLVVLAGSALLSAVQGGFITEAARGLVTGWLGLAAGQSSNFYSFSLRWPPAIYSAHLGVLSLLQPAQLLVLVLELGPALLLAPAATRAAWRAYRRGEWIPAALGLAALMNFIFPMFIQYGVDRSITRLPGTALWLWLALAIPPAWEWQKANKTARTVFSAGFVAINLGGLVTGAIQLANIPYPQLSYYINGVDARISAETWGRLDPNYLVLDRIPYRGVTLVGLGTRSNDSIYGMLDDWRELSAHSDPQEAARDGYGYVYLDQYQWHGFSGKQKAAYQQPCVRLVSEVIRSAQDAAWLYDIRDCADSPQQNP